MTDQAGRVDQVDPRVHGALAAMEVPGHDDQFWHALGTRLIAEREAPAAPTFDPLERLDQVDSHPAPPQEGADSGRRARRRDRTFPDERFDAVRPTVSHLAEHAARTKQHRPNWRRRALVTRSVVAVSTVLGLAIWLGAHAEPASQTATAGELAGRLSRRLSGSQYLLGEVNTVGFGPGSGRYTFVRSSDGSLRYRGVDRRSDLAYDAANGSAQSWRVRDTGTSASEDRGLAPGPPDPDGASRYLQDDELGAMVHALDASPGTPARSRIRHGRKVWMVDVRLPTSSDSPFDGMQVIVDQRRGLPVEVDRSVKGAVVERKQFSDVRQTSSVPQDTFRFAFPTGISAAQFDNGFQRTRLPAAGSLVGYAAVTPQWLPRGFELSTLAVLPGSPQGLSATAGGDNPPDRDVLSLAYRNGVDRLTLTLRRVSSPSDSWKDPFVGAPGTISRVQRVRLEGGRFLGATVEQVTAPGAAPHLWGRSADFVFTVAGDLDPSQLLQVANSLQ